MGNKSSRRKSASDATTTSSKRRKKPSRSSSAATSPPNGKHDKHISCPDLGAGAVPYRQYDEEPKIKYNIYRSYRDLDNNKLKDGMGSNNTSTVDFRIYRRSTAELPSARPQTLPRGFGRSKSAYVDGGARRGGTMTPNGGEMYLDWERAHAVQTPDSEYGGRSASEYGRSGRSSRLSKRSSIASSCGTMSSKITQVHATDFPCTAAIKRKLAYFEEQYTQALVQKYAQLPQSDQLASLAIAIRKRFGQTQTITLLTYMEGESVPSDLLSPSADNSGSKYVLCVPEALYRGLEYARNSGHKKPKLWAVLARDVVMCVGVESGNELTRIYEYQIALMFDDASIRVLANHAAECVVDYVRNNTYLDRNSALHGVISNVPPNPDGHPKFLAVIIGDKEMKWDLYDIFKKNGLRKEVSLQRDDLIQDPDEDTLDQDPWTFHYCTGAEPMPYGYRGQLIEWNFVEHAYELNQEEDEKFEEEAIWRPEDFHRLYMSYKRLFGRQVMETFSKMEKKDDTPDKLADRLKSEFDGNEERDEIQPVYRPLGKEEEPINFADVSLDNMDLSRISLRPSGDLKGASFQNSRLLLADVPKVEWECLKGADVSYSTLDSTLNPERIKEIVARHVALRRSMSPKSPKSRKSLQSPKSPTSPGLEQTKVNGVQETNLDQAAPLNVVIENDAEYPSTKAMVSNSEGQMVPIMQIIQEKQRKLSEEERESIKARDEVDQSSAATVASIHSPLVASAPVTVVTHEKLRAEKKKKRQQRRRPQSDLAIHNISAGSEHSSTNFNVLEDKCTAKRAPLIQRSTTFDQGFSAGGNRSSTAGTPHMIPPIETRTVSASSIPVNHHYHQVAVHHHNSTISSSSHNSINNTPSQSDNEAPHSRPSSATPTADDSREQSRSPSQGRSLSSSHIPTHETYNNYHHHHNGAGGGQENTLPPVRGTRVTSTLPRMVKSVSHHGHLKGSHLGFPPLNRRQRSAADIEYIRRSQIFHMMKGLTIINLEDNLPDVGAMFVGREREVSDVTDLLSAPGRIITMFGCSGIGKSSLAITAALEMKPKGVVPVHFDCRGCTSTESIWKVMMITLELRFKLTEIVFFYNWVNCREQRPLFVFDNVDLPFLEDRKLSEMIDNLMANVKNLRVLCTCDRNFFRGQSSSSHESYRVGALMSSASQSILGVMVPDLHEEGVEELAAAADYVLQGMMINGKSFGVEDVDSGKLYEDLTSPTGDDFPVGKLEDVLAEKTSDDMDKQKLGKVARCVYTVLEFFHPEVRELLVKLSCTCSFNMETACKLTGYEEEKVKELLSELVNCYMLVAVTKHGGRFYIPKVVKIALDTCWPDNGSNSRSFVFHFVQILKELCARYHSKECREALDIVDAEFDNILDALNRILEREDAFELCADFATPEFAMFLYEILPRGLYEDLYDSLVQQAEEQSSWVVQMYALTSLAHMHLAEHELERAKLCAERAYAIAQKHGNNRNEAEKAHCMLYLGKVYWQDKDTKDKAEMLVKKALDTLKLGFGLRHLRTLYANEEYGYILTEKGSFQTARHFYNLSDFIVKELLDTHPLLLEGYNCRRAIWDHLCLFARATDVAERAASTALLHLADHPTTAAVLAHQCDAIMRRGSLSEAVQIAIRALAVRIKVLGESEATAGSYRTVAALLMRSGQYDEALRFGQSALDIYDKLDSSDRLRIETKNVMAQCRFRLDCRATRFVELESRPDASKRNVGKDEMSASMSSALSTEV